MSRFSKSFAELQEPRRTKSKAHKQVINMSEAMMNQNCIPRRPDASSSTGTFSIGAAAAFSSASCGRGSVDGERVSAASTSMDVSGLRRDVDGGVSFASCGVAITSVSDDILGVYGLGMRGGKERLKETGRGHAI